MFLSHYSCISVVRYSTLTACQISATTSVVRDGPVNQGMVNIVGVPRAVICPICSRADQAKEALVDIHFKVCPNLACLRTPVCGLAEIAIVDNVVAHVVVQKCCIDAPRVQKDSNLDIARNYCEVVAAAQINPKHLAHH